MKFFRNLKHIFIVSALAIGTILAGARLSSGEFTDALNGFFLYRTGNGAWQDIIYRHTLTPSDDIVLVTIDEKTLNEFQAKNTLKTLSIPKSIYAMLVQKMESAGVRGIGFDILFQNVDNTENVFVDMLAKYNNIAIATNYNADLCQIQYADIRSQLDAKTGIRDTYPPKVSGENCLSTLRSLVLEYRETQHINYPQWSLFEQKPDTTLYTDEEKLFLFCSISADGTKDCPGLPRSIYKNIPWGMANIVSAYERPFRVDISDQPYLSWKTGTGKTVSLDMLSMETLPLALYRLTDSGALVSHKMPTYKKTLIDDPTDRTRLLDHVLQPYFGGPGIYRTISLIDVMDMSMKDIIQNFHGKYVFIGESGTHINDKKISPVTNTNMDGVEMHAHLLDGLIQNKMLSRINLDIETGLLIFISVFSVALYFLLPKYLSPIFAGVIILGIFFVGRYIYDVQRVVIDIFEIFLAGGVLTYPLTFVYRFFIVDREKRGLQNNFGHYIDPHVVEEIVNRGEDIQLGGESRELSVLFSDIAGFTTISESLPPRELFYLMTSYLSNMTDILIGQGGTLDKYIGDAVMGFFGAPLSYTDHAIRAANTAILMRERLPSFNADLEAHGMKPIDFRVGIATGEVMVGNIGSHDRFNYTVLGDTVNLASRLEGTGKEYDVHIIIPESTKKLLGPLFLTRELDTIAVKGKTEGVRIYELIGYSVKYPDRNIYITYERALGFYREENYREAGKLWQSIAKIDPPSRVMMFRCLEILKGNIVVENGVYHMTHK